MALAFNFANANHDPANVLLPSVRLQRVDGRCAPNLRTEPVALKSAQVVFDWPVMKFSQFVDSRQSVTSKYFNSPCVHTPIQDACGRSEDQWYLALYPHGVGTEAAQGYLSLYLCLSKCLSECNQEHAVTYTFSIVNINASAVLSDEAAAGLRKDPTFGPARHVFPAALPWPLCNVPRALNATPPPHMPQIPHAGVDQFLKRLHLPGLLLNDTLTIRCALTVGDTSLAKGACLRDNLSLSDDLGQLFLAQRSGDIKLRVGVGSAGKVILAHKDILASRSPVFAAMFEHDVTERESGEVDIIDLHPDTVHEMLYYIYTDKVPMLKFFARELLEAANKYNLQHLLTMCEEHLCSTVKAENAADLVVFADFHSAGKLKNRAMSYISQYPMKVIATNGWEELSRSCPLLAEMFVQLANTLK